MRDVVHPSSCPRQIHNLAHAVARSLRPRKFARLAVAALGAAAVGAAPVGVAATFIVTNTNPSGPGSLEQALQDANDSAGPDKVTFARGTKGKITLIGTRQIEFSSLVIEGPGANNLTIEGDGQSALFEVVFGELSLSGLRLSNSDRVVSVPEVGGPTGGIVNVNDCAISNMGSAAFAGTYLNIEVVDSTITGNGSGIYADTAHVRNSLIAHNAGDAVRANEVRIVDSIISENARSGIVQVGHGYLQMSGSTVASNGSHGIVLGEFKHFRVEEYFSRFSADIRSSTITSNARAGIQGYAGDTDVFEDFREPENEYRSVMVVDNTTIVNNGGGGVAVSIGKNGTISGTIASTTIASNTATHGGGISVTTVPDMPDAGNLPSDGLRLDHTIVAKNKATESGPDLFTDLAGFSFDLNYSLVQTTDSASITSTDGMASNVLGQDPRLSRLQDLGGITRVRGLEQGSPAIDRGRAFNEGDAFDQRGAGYLRLVGERRDIGAVEQQASEVTPVLMQVLPDVNGNATPDIATVVRVMDSGTATLHVHDAQSGVAITSAVLSGTKAVLALQVVPDMNSNGKPELAILRNQPAKVELRDALDGQALGNIGFTNTLLAHALGILPDINGNGEPELAALGRQDKRNVVEIRDAESAKLIRTITFDTTAAPRHLTVLPDVNGNGEPDVVGLFEKANPTLDDLLEIRDAATGNLVRSIAIAKGREVVESIVVGDINGNGQPDLAVLRAGVANVELFDAGTGASLGDIGFNPFYVPLHAATVPDASGGTINIAVLGRSIKDGSLRAEVRDIETHQLRSTVHFSALYRPDSFTVVPDIDGNGMAELSHTGVALAGHLRSTQKDAHTGVQVSTINH